MDLIKKDSQKYEYAFEVIDDKRGGVNLDAITAVTGEKTKHGWRLIFVFTNELGKNAVSVGGFGINSSVDQTILVFEREIKQDVSLFHVEVPILESNLISPFVPKTATIFEKSGNIYVQLQVFSRQDYELKGLQGDLVIRNVFGDAVTVEDVCFFSFQQKKGGYLISSPFPITLPDKISYGIANAGLSVKRYIGNDQLDIPEDTDISSIAEAQASNAGSFDIHAFLQEAETLHNASEIYDRIRQIKETDPSVFNDKILRDLDKIVYMERAYGNMKHSAIKSLTTYFDELGTR